MKRLLLLTGWLALLAVSAAAQSIDPTASLYSTGGRGINWRQNGGTFPPAGTPANPSPNTNSIFRGMLVYGAVTRPVTTTNTVLTGGNFAANAVNLDLSRGTNGTTVIAVLRSAQVGAPFYSRQVAAYFGSIITPPVLSENGTPVSPGYWNPEPIFTRFTTNTYGTARYYWSPHAGVVFATQPGPIQISWLKAQGSASAPGGVSGVNYTNLGGIYYTITNSSYVISGSAAKTARKIYWTEKTFRQTGKPVEVPAARVGVVNVVYNSIVPEKVPAEYQPLGQTLITAQTNLLQETRTLWHENGQIHAYNAEGRVFVELLGDSMGDGKRQHLGYEIVDIAQQPFPTDLNIELGERIQAYADGSGDSDLNPEPLQEAINGTQPFLYRSSVNGSERVEFYATRETANQNDVLVYWMEAGVVNLRWPLIYARYQLTWPSEVGKYSHYVRPLVATEAEAKLTAVPLPNENVPAIQYQDPLDFPRGKLTETFAYYSFLDANQPAHRALLRFTAGDRVAFERVFSWLDVNLKTNFSELGRNPAARGLTWVAAQARGGNGEWKLFVSDDQGGDSGSLDSWELLVVSTNLAVGSLVTNVFGSDGGITIRDLTTATPYPSIINVKGIVAPVVAIQVRFNGLAHTYPRDIDAFLVGPRGNVCALMSDAGGVGPGISGANLLFSDTAASAVPIPIVSGAYRPTDLEVGEALPPDGTGSIGTSLAALLLPVDLADPGLANGYTAPRIINRTAEVGRRIDPPADEAGVNLAGHIHQAYGNSFHPGAYINPLESGFAAAQLGAIIPVNAIPGTNNLDVWWFRPSSPTAASSGVKLPVNGFKPIYWPAVIGRYTLVWPAAPSEIVLASNDGSGALPSLQAKGTIYVQNDPALPGYNPNEEHALVLGGQAYALRDDLNRTAATMPAVLAGAGATYSSQPFVLLDYTESDGRPALRAFKVLREKPSAGIVFDYIVQAGANQAEKSGSKPLQAPMPLPFLPQPIEIQTNGTGAAATFTRVNYNTEPSAYSGDLPANWNSLSSSDQQKYANYRSFTYRDRKDQFWVLRGVHAGLPALAGGRYTGSTFLTNLLAATAIVGQPFTNTFHVSRPAGSLSLELAAGSPALPNGLTLNGLTLTGTPTAANPLTNYVFVLADQGDDARVTITLPLTVVASGTAVAQAPLVITSTNVYSQANVTYVGRPPFLASAATNTNCFTMRFYYKTQEGFAWPGDTTPPAVGSIVPYLRPANSTADPGAKETAALDIVYRPVWPGDPPKLQFGETLMAAGNNRPAVRGQTSVQLLYQQAIAQAITNSPARPAMVLHDPTREKVFFLKTNSTDGLDKLPDGVSTDSYQGRFYFPKLPPHLAQRFFYDPNRGGKGALVFLGEYQEQGFSKHDWVLLNVLRGTDLANVKGLCPDNPADQKSNWDKAVDGLATIVETFYENPRVPGQFIVNSNLTVSRLIGELTEISDSDTAVDSYALSASGPGQGYVTMIVGNGGAFTPAEEPVSVYVLRVAGSLFPGEVKVIPSENPLSELLTFQHNADLAGRFAEYEYEWKISPPVDGTYPATDSGMSLYQGLVNGLDIPRYTLGGSGIQGLVDNYIVLRYRPKTAAHPLFNVWSEWTEPALAEGWIKRVLAKINPFNQRVTDLYNNTVNTDASVLTAAGRRWEGDIALNMSTINNYGLIEIYETILRRGRGLSIDAGINFGPANDALLLAAGYLNDLYMLVGNEAYADAANPTIGIGTKDRTYGEVATALFAFKGQVPALLEEELGLLRGRDDFLQPGVDTGPVYNRFVWNYTRGIDAGEVIYALNYNILDQNTDGRIDAADAMKLYPQGHGDAYGHYLTAVKGYYSLLMNNKFDWVPRIEAVTILGKAVAVDYLDERKFAAAAAAVARTGRQVFDLTWRKEYQPGQNLGWRQFSATRANSSRQEIVTGTRTNSVVREWGVDQWACRTGQGAFLNWIVGNAILPDVDPDPAHEGIQKVDRTTVPELTELVVTAADLQTAMENAEGRLTPLGLAAGSLAFDLNPNTVVGTDPQTHFEQIYTRAKAALNNAVVSFDDAKDITRLMRSEEDSLADFAAAVTKQELSYTNALIELYGTPYTDDIGPGKTFKQGYAGPDFIHHMYVDNVQLTFPGQFDPLGDQSFRIDLQTSSINWLSGQAEALNVVVLADASEGNTNGVTYLEYNVDSHGFTKKPSTWTGRRQSPGRLQQAISGVIQARLRVLAAMGDAEGAKSSLDDAIRKFKSAQDTTNKVDELKNRKYIAEKVVKAAEVANEIFELVQDNIKEDIVKSQNVVREALPNSLVAGLAAGGDLTSAARAALTAGGLVFETVINGLTIARKTALLLLREGNDQAAAEIDLRQIDPLKTTQATRESLAEIADLIGGVQGHAVAINSSLQAYDDARRAYQAALAEGERIQAEREGFRKRAAAVIQGFRTRDAAFRIFRNEKLERYKSLFDLASRFGYLAANAYDYETGLLGSGQGGTFVSRIINSRALGVVRDGEPQYAGSNTGDPGLSSALAEMKADWDVLKGRLGFNNPDAYGTTASLRTGKLRILPTADGDATWQDVLQQGRRDNLLDDADVRRYCLQIDTGTGLPVPGIVLTFSTTIAEGMNLFGLPLAAGDRAFNVSAFATKLFGMGVALEGYRGMQDPVANGTAVNGAGGTSPADPTLSYLDPLALSGDPYVYLIPVGVDSMRSPPLGDARGVRSWSVDDVAIPLPFNIGASDFSAANLYQSADSLSEPLFALRKHQAFRPVATTTAFSSSIYTDSGSLRRSQFTNNRLIGRSAWNSQWKLVIPGNRLLNDPKEGLDRFIQTVKDVKLHFITYSYSGN